MHETPKGSNPMQDREQQQSMDRQQNQQGGTNRKPGEGMADGASGMQTEESGAGYGNNAGNQGSEAERGR